MKNNNFRMLGASLITFGLLSAQAPTAPNPTQDAATVATSAMPIYRVTVTERTAKAINYHNRGGATKIDFQGTALLPKSHGQAKVESKQGYIEIEVEFRELKPASTYGPEYLTYVMWGITPEGRTTNLGEVLLNGTSSKLDVTTELQSFGLIITAEPYFAVTQPSDVVVMENVIRKDTVGAVEPVEAKYELLKRGQYTLNVNAADVKPLQLDPKTPLDLYEARNAVQIARWTGAERYAGDTYKKATDALATAEGYLKRKAGTKPIATMSRSAVQTAEDARIITVKRMDEERLANERQAGLDREAKSETARAAAQSETERIAQDAEKARIAAQVETQRVAREHDVQTAAAQAETERLKAENAAKIAAAQAEQDRLKVDADAKLGAAQAEKDRLKLDNDAKMAAARAEQDRLKADNDAKMASAQAEAERLKRENDAQRNAAQAELDRAAADKLKAEAEKSALRAQLLVQFNAILQTRDTARGLIVNMSDVLFDTAKFSLRPAAREKLARVAGILSGHPGLRLQIEGFTDSVGKDAYNQELSEHRANSVRDYLTHAGIADGSVTATGFGKSQPVASNDTASGRQQNRRVELVISGEIIGSEIRATPVVAAN
jgi:outer membrane protein OmpA-like peptidoglycan-associated protein